jgi:hypothetical protein
MLTALTIEDILEWNKSHKSVQRISPNYSKESEEDKMYAAFYYLLQYYSFKESCITALVKLKEISADENFLESPEIKTWLLFYEWLGTKNLVTFLIDNEPDEEKNILKILGLNMDVELLPFIPIIIFCEIFQILYWELQLHLPESKKEFDKPEDYYYRSPDPVPAALRIRAWLKVLN